MKAPRMGKVIVIAFCGLIVLLGSRTSPAIDKVQSCPPEVPWSREEVELLFTDEGLATNLAQLGLASASMDEVRLLVEASDQQTCNAIRLALAVDLVRGGMSAYELGFYQVRDRYIVTAIPPDPLVVADVVTTQPSMTFVLSPTLQVIGRFMGM